MRIIERLKDIPISEIYPHKDNPRKELGDLSELSESIRHQGIMQNLTVIRGHRMTDDEWKALNIQYATCPDEELRQRINSLWSEDGYTVIIGHRRLAAAQQAGCETVPCTIAKMTPAEQVQTMLLENMQRADLTIYEQAQGFQMMMDFGDTVDTIAEKTGFSESTIRRRLKIAEMDGDTLKAVSERQVSLMDYDRLSQIENIDTRNSVLAEIGTNNFNRKLQAALDAQAARKKKEAWLLIFKNHGMTEIAYNDIWQSKYESLGYVDGEPDEQKILDLLKDHDVLYYAWGYNSTPYIRADKVLSDEDDEMERERQRRIDEDRQRRDRLSNLSKSAFKLRFDFVKHYSYRDSKKNIKKISDWMCLREIVSMVSRSMFSGYATVQANKTVYAQLFDVKGGEDWQKVADFVNAHPEKALLMNVYAQWCDSESENCCDYSNNFRENPKLKNLYQCLCALGYTMSDEEKQMVNGTHPLYKKSDTEAIDTEGDEIEESEDLSDDDFDLDLEEQLREVLGSVDEE